jgi:hypothetical protein
MMLVEQAASVKLMFECAIQTNNLSKVPLAFYMAQLLTTSNAMNCTLE